MANGNDSAKSPNMLGAAAMQFASRYANVAIQLVITAVLARLLSPTEFGTVAVVTVFTSFFAIFADLGIGPAIVQFTDLEESDLNALFSFSGLLAIALSVSFCILSIPISVIYNDPALIPLCCCSAPSILFNTLNMVPNGIMLRDKQFASIGIRLIVATVASGVLGIALALLGLGSYALIAQAIATAFVVFIWNYLRSNVHFGRHGIRSALRRVAHFSGFQAAFQFVNYFSRNLDNLLTGALMGPAELGQYDKTYKLMQMPNTYLSGIFSSVLQPYLAKYARELDRVYDFWVRMSKFLALIGVWASLICFFGAEETIEILYGPQWSPAVPALKMLSLSIAFQMVNSTGGAILQSIEHTDYLFSSGIIDAGISCICIIIGTTVFGRIDALGACVSVAYLGHACVNLYYICGKGLKQPLVRVALRFARIAVAALATFGACALLFPLLPHTMPLVDLIIKAAAISAILLATTILVGERQAFGFFSYAKHMDEDEG